MNATPIRVALVTDAADDIGEFAGSLESGRYELVGVLVAPVEYEMARSTVSCGVRCVTHPRELATTRVDVCVAWRGERVLERHRAALPETLSAEDFERIRHRA